MTPVPDSIGAICLDLDDTLWPVAPAIARAERRLMAWMGQVCPRVLQRYTLDGMRQQRDEMLRRYPDRGHDMTFLRRRLLAEMLVESGYGDELADSAFEVFFHARNQVDLYGDVLPALQRLSARYPLVAVSNGNADLARVGLDHFFVASVQAREVGTAKPGGAIFKAAARRAGVQPGRVLHVGDDPHADVHGAREAGMQVAWIDRAGEGWRHPAPAPEWIVADLQELANRLGLAPGGQD